MKIYSLFFIILVELCVCSCNDNWREPINRKSIYTGPYYDLIKAVSDNDTDEIKQQVNTNKLNINYRDKQYGITLLEWALKNNKKEAFRKILEMGGNPNFRDSISNTPVIVMAAAEQDITYLKYCLAHKGDPNVSSIKDMKNGNSYLTPLDAAVSYGTIENIDLLINNGADVNYSSDNFVPLTSALILNLPAAYFLLKNGADPLKVRWPILNSNDTLNICQLLRNKEEDLISDDYVIKMKIVKYLKDKYNLDYFNTPIPQGIKKVHNADYLSKY
jgi:ankyrin repeat protein